MKLVTAILMVLSGFSLAEASVATSSYRQGDWDVGGFLDLRFREGDLDPDRKGFSVYDGAFKVSGRLEEKYQLIIDVPFGWGGSQDTSASAAGFTANTWGVAWARGQAYFDYKNIKWLLRGGQFDSPLGYENNDSVDLIFADQGLNFKWMTPTTHVGVKGEYYFNDQFQVHGIISNPQGQGSYGDETPEYAVQFLIQSENEETRLYALPGFYTRRTAGGETESLFDICLGMSSRIVDLHLEMNQKDQPGANKNAKGIMLLVNWHVSLDMALGLRLESIKDSLAPGVLTDANQLSLAINYKASDWIQLRGDISLRQMDAGGTDVDGEQVNFIFIHRL